MWRLKTLKQDAYDSIFVLLHNWRQIKATQINFPVC